MFKLLLEKSRGTRNQIANICWIIEKVREFQKNIYFCFIDYAKAFDFLWITNCGKFLMRWEYQTTFSASWETCMQVKKQQLEPYLEQWTGWISLQSKGLSRVFFNTTVQKHQFFSFFWNSFAFSIIQRMLAIWSLVPLPFLNPAWTLEVHGSLSAKTWVGEFWALLY